MGPQFILINRVCWYVVFVKFTFSTFYLFSLPGSVEHSNRMHSLALSIEDCLQLFYINKNCVCRYCLFDIYLPVQIRKFYTSVR